MPRPRKRMWVGAEPGVSYFKPRAVPLKELEEVSLTVNEFEALRLADVGGLGQADCAERMGVSQPTFNRTLRSARKKVSSAIVQGKAIRIEGGFYSLKK